MQNSFCPTWFQGLAARNHPARVRSHCLLRFSVLYFAAFTAGVLLCRHTFLGDSAALRSLGEAVLRAPFAGCRYARDYVRAVLHTARWDWGILALIALSGYTFVSRTLSNAALTVHALLFGALSHTLLRALSAGDIAPASGNLAFFLYFFAQLASVGILLTAATEALVFSYAYRDASHTSGDRLSAHFTLQSTSHAGMILIVHAAHTHLWALLDRML